MSFCVTFVRKGKKNSLIFACASQADTYARSVGGQVTPVAREAPTVEVQKCPPQPWEDTEIAFYGKELPLPLIVKGHHQIVGRLQD